jgi:hypothetical protein
MFRVLGISGLAILFLVISGSLRQTVLDAIDSLGKTIEVYSPFSYIVIGFAVLGGMMICLYKAAQPRV